jgi:hypothetical protein
MKRLFSLLLVGLLATACNGTSESSVSTTTATAPTATITSETFSGTVDISGRAFHPFTVALSGSQVNVNLTAAGPPSTIYMGLGVGGLTDGVCTLLTNGSVVTQAGATAQLAGTLNAGSYCVMVYDAGNQLAQVSYSVVVNHY